MTVGSLSVSCQFYIVPDEPLHWYLALNYSYLIQSKVIDGLEYGTFKYEASNSETRYHLVFGKNSNICDQKSPTHSLGKQDIINFTTRWYFCRIPMSDVSSLSQL